jgi:hypothetical protein
MIFYYEFNIKYINIEMKQCFNIKNPIKGKYLIIKSIYIKYSHETNNDILDNGGLHMRMIP